MTEWTEGMIARLRELNSDQTLSRAEIGRRLGVSKNAVMGKARRLGLPSRPRPINPSGQPRKHVRTRPAVPTLASLIALVTVPAVPERPEPRFMVRTSCQYPLNSGRPWRFCEADAQRGSVYCPEHHRTCYVKAAGWWEDAA